MQPMFGTQCHRCRVKPILVNLGLRRRLAVLSLLVSFGIALIARVAPSSPQGEQLTVRNPQSAIRNPQSASPAPNTQHQAALKDYSRLIRVWDIAAGGRPGED